MRELAPMPVPAEDVLVVKDDEAPAEEAPALSERLPGSLRTLAFTKVRAEPRLDAPELGVIAPNTRLPRRSRLKTPGCPAGWLEVEPRGFVCGKLTRDARPASEGLLPRIPRGSVVPGVYGKIRASGAVLFASVEDARAGNGRQEEASLTVQRLGTTRVDGKTYWRTRHGLVAASSVRKFRSSRFQGVDLAKETELKLPIAWTLRGKERFTVPLLQEPSASAPLARRERARQRYAVEAVSEDGEFVKLGDRAWIARKSVRLATAADPPTGLAEGERWLDVDLDEQTLVAYEGTTPVYVTMVSSGKVHHGTPTGVYRVERKVALRTMNSMADSKEDYSVDKVPWTTYFAHGYALHAAYWHNSFGRTKSHGCVNLAPIDARRLYAWMTPTVAPGWVEIYGSAEQPGSVVRIRNRKNPDPPWKGYAAKMREPA